MRNPYNDQSATLGYSFLAAREAIRANMAANPTKAEYTNTELIQVLITAGVIADASEVNGHTFLLPDIEAWLAQFQV